MKYFFLIVSFFFSVQLPLFAQEDDNDHNGIRDRMNEYIQHRLDLSKEEAARFTPVFLEYYKEWRRTLRENREDALERQKKIIDLRIRYRVRFREILGERRGSQVFGHQDAFIRGMRDIIEERRMGNPPPRRNRRF
jgi:hypothetical protein